MTEPNSLTLRVPATTANLGPGFDCLGLALDMWNEISIELAGEDVRIRIEGEGVGQLPQDNSNLILRAAKRLYDREKQPFPKGISLRCKNAIPTCSGLGSSASAVIAGLCAARKLLHSQISDEDLLSLAAEFEGHADNAAACLLGGLVIVNKAQNSWIVEKVPIQPLKAVIVLPEVKLSTQEARAALPASIVRQDAVDNIARTTLLIYALREGRKDLLKHAMQDHVHQPYRLKLIPGAEAALQAAYDAGAYGAALSGAGPSLIAFGDENLEEIGKAMQRAFSDKAVSSKVYLIASSAVGIEYRPTE